MVINIYVWLICSVVELLFVWLKKKNNVQAWSTMFNDHGWCLLFFYCHYAHHYCVHMVIIFAIVVVLVLVDIRVSFKLKRKIILRELGSIISSPNGWSSHRLHRYKKALSGGNHCVFHIQRCQNGHPLPFLLCQFSLLDLGVECQHPTTNTQTLLFNQPF